MNRSPIRAGRSPMVTRALAHRRALADAEAGFSLVELLVTVIIVGIVLSMTVVIVSTFIVQAANTQRVGLASETAQSAMAQIDQYLRGAVSPANVQSSAAAATGTTDSCWDTTSPAPVGGVPLNQTQSESLAIISAHDFDVWFCGFKSGDPQPHVWQITMNTGPGMCANTDPLGGYCTLQLIDHGTDCIPGQGLTPGGQLPCTNPTGSPTTGEAVLSIPDVWCDQYCQGTGAVTETFTTSSGAPTQTYAVACIDQYGKTAPQCVGATPPLFQYYLGTVSVSGAQGGQYYCNSTGSGTCSPAPINPTCSGPCTIGSYTLPDSGPGAVCTINCDSPLDLSVSAVPLGPGAAPAINLLAGIELVVVSFTVGATANAGQTIDNGTPGASLSNQVFLVNQVNRGYQACGYDTALAGLANADANWQMTDTGGSVGNAPVVDSSVLGASDNAPDTGQIQGNVNQLTPPVGVQEGEPGPLACNTSSPAMLFPGTGNNYIQTPTSSVPARPSSGPSTPSVRPCPRARRASR